MSSQRRGRRKPPCKCAYGPCDVVITPQWDGQKWQRFCSKSCANRCNCENPEAVERRARASREAWARRHEAARAAGMTTDELLEARLEEYWRKVEDPEYYRDLRGVTSQSTLRGVA